MKIIDKIKRNLLYKKYNLNPIKMMHFEKMFLPENNVVNFDKLSNQKRREIEIDSILLPAEETTLIGLTKNQKNKEIVARQYDINLDHIRSGHRKKEFVMCTTNAFDELITELRTNPHSSYKTYISDIIKEGITPKYVSALKYLQPYSKSPIAHIIASKISNSNECVSETISSRILNYIGTPTVFNTYALYNGDPNSTISDNKHTQINTLSVDFIGKNERFITTNDIMSSIEHIEPQLQEQLITNTNIIKNYHITTLTPEKMDSAIDNMIDVTIDTYLSRKYLLNDTDYKIGNTGWIINDATSEIYPAPNFDLEYTLNERLQNYNINSKDIQFIKDNYPEKLDKFIIKCNSLITPNSNGLSPLDTILDNSGITKDTAQLYKDVIVNNINVINYKCTNSINYAQENTLT